MENKMFELLTKMYSEFTDFRRETQSAIKGLTEKIHTLECQVLQFKDETNIKLDALFDGYRQTYELAKENNAKLDILTDKVERHELEIKALKRKRMVEFA